MTDLLSGNDRREKLCACFFVKFIIGSLPSMDRAYEKKHQHTDHVDYF